MKKRLVVFCQLLPVIISLFLIGAHFLRSGNILLTGLSLLLVMALAVREPLVARTVQVSLLLAAGVWLYLGFDLVYARLEAGTPWVRLAAIIGAVAGLSIVSTFVFLSKELKAMYHLAGVKAEERQNDTSGPSRASLGKKEPGSGPEKRQKLLAAHHRKIILHNSIFLALLSMDYSIGLGMVILIVIGLISANFRRKIQGIGGTLSPADRQKLYGRQSLGLLLGSLLIIGYYSWAMPAIKQPILFVAVMLTVPALMWVAARFEYLHLGQKG